MKKKDKLKYYKFLNSLPKNLIIYILFIFLEYFFRY